MGIDGTGRKVDKGKNFRSAKGLHFHKDIVGFFGGGGWLRVASAEPGYGGEAT